MSDEVDELTSLLNDESARAILEAAQDEPLSAAELGEICGISSTTVYRRIEQLQAHDLLTDYQRLDPDGHHHKVYLTQVQRVTVELQDDGFTCTVDRDGGEDAADRFTRLYEGFK